MTALLLEVVEGHEIDVLGEGGQIGGRRWVAAAVDKTLKVAQIALRHLLAPRQHHFRIIRVVLARRRRRRRASTWRALLALLLRVRVRPRAVCEMVCERTRASVAPGRRTWGDGIEAARRAGVGEAEGRVGIDLPIGCR